MTRHMIYNLCVLVLQLGFAYLFRLLNMPTMVDVANLTGLFLLTLPVLGLVVPKWRNWLTKRIWER